MITLAFIDGCIFLYSDTDGDRGSVSVLFNESESMQKNLPDQAHMSNPGDKDEFAGSEKRNSYPQGCASFTCSAIHDAPKSLDGLLNTAWA